MSALPETNEYLLTIYEIQKPLNRTMTKEDIEYYINNVYENMSLSKLIQDDGYKKFYVDLLDYAAVVDFNINMEYNPNTYSVKDIVVICKVIDRITLVLPPEDSLIPDIYTDNSYLLKIKKRYKRNDMLQQLYIPIFNHKMFLSIEKLEIDSPNDYDTHIET